MRHVVIGCDTVLGSSISRTLASMEGFEIVLCSPTGMLPAGIPREIVALFPVDLMDPHSLLEVIRDGDIVYNAQVILDDDADLDEVELINHTGLINLLGVVSLREVKRLITVIPAIRGRKKISNVDENTVQKNSSAFHKITINAKTRLQQYIDGESFGWDEKEILEWANPSKPTKELDDEKDESTNNGDKSSDEESSSGPPSLESSGPPSLGSSGPPSLGSSGPPSLGSSGPPSLGSSGPPSLGSSGPPSLGSSGPPSLSSESDTNDISSELDEFEKITRADVIVAQLGRIFGPGDNAITKEICQNVRMERFTLTGRTRKCISWTVPEDAARAILIMGDPSVKPNYYNIFSFTASLTEIIEEMDSENYSSSVIKRKNIFIKKIKHFVCKVLSMIKLCSPGNYESIVRYNYEESIDQTLAIAQWAWEPQFDLKSTVDASLKWYVNYMI